MAGGDRSTRKTSKGKGVARQGSDAAPESPRTNTAEELVLETQARIQELSDHDNEGDYENSGTRTHEAGDSSDPDKAPAPPSGRPPISSKGTSNLDRSSLRTTVGPSSGRQLDQLGPSVARVTISTTRDPGGATRSLHDENHHNNSHAPTPRSGSNSTPIGGTPPYRRTPGHEPALTSTNDNFIQSLLMKVFEAQAAGATPDEVARLQANVTLASQTLLRPVGPLSDRPRAAHDDAGKLMGTLNKVQPKPKLGTDSRVPTPQQVAQWILDVETAFRSVQALEDSDTRTYWILSTIQYGVHRELIQQKVNDGLIRTWDGLKSEQRQLVQDPVLTKYQNFSKFFNFEWRNGDTINSFMLQLSKKESMLHRSFFRTPEGVDDDELKIAFVWAKVPEAFRREMQRNGVLENIREWTEFERALRNAETAVSDVGTTSTRRDPEDNSGRGKRHASSHVNPKTYGKKQDRKPSSQAPYHRRTSPGRRDASPAGDRRPSGNEDKRNDSYRPSNYSGGNQKQHWKNQNREKQDSKRDERRDDNAEKDKP